MFEVVFILDGLVEDTKECDTLEDALKVFAEWTNDSVRELRQNRYPGESGDVSVTVRETKNIITIRI